MLEKLVHLQCGLLFKQIWIYMVNYQRNKYLYIEVCVCMWGKLTTEGT